MIKAPNPHPLMREEAPMQPHLGVVMDEAGSLMALPPGAQIFIIENPKDPSKIVPTILKKVSKKALIFRCACGQRGCTREYHYQLKMTGFHPHASGR